MAHELSDYEKIRIANIQRNNNFLTSIGLNISTLHGKKQSTNEEEKNKNKNAAKAKNNNQNDNHNNNGIIDENNVRRSSRAKNQGSSELTSKYTNNDNTNNNEDDEEYIFEPLPLDYVTKKSYTTRIDRETANRENFNCGQLLSDFILNINPEHAKKLKFKVRRTSE